MKDKFLTDEQLEGIEENFQAYLREVGWAENTFIINQVPAELVPKEIDWDVALSQTRILYSA